MAVLTIDVGGTNVKIMVEGNPERRRCPSGKALTGQAMVDDVIQLATGWDYDRISIGLPAPIEAGLPRHEPVNLGGGWMDCQWAKAFRRPVRLLNDAAMQAVGHDAGGRMLFLGLGTGLGSAIVADHKVIPCELAHLPFRKGDTFEERIGNLALEREGKVKWTKRVFEMIEMFRAAIQVDEVVIGGGNVRLIDPLPDGCRRGQNILAFEGGFRVWREPWVNALDSQERVLMP
ncbi:MAG: ROK family protein [Planctomycetota bacterium]|nr:ROK family protein [Planctomycetota bacterium]